MGFTRDVWQSQMNINDCEDRPCQNGAVCVDLLNGYRCECMPGFRGEFDNVS